MAKDKNFTFAPRDCHDMTLANVSEKWAQSMSRVPVNLWALNTNCSEMAKDTNRNFKFGRPAPGDIPDMSAE